MLIESDFIMIYRFFWFFFPQCCNIFTSIKAQNRIAFSESTTSRNFLADKKLGFCNCEVFIKSSLSLCRRMALSGKLLTEEPMK